MASLSVIQNFESFTAMFLIGLTGGAATGKSTTSAHFRRLGVPVIDADEVARSIVSPGQPAFKEIKATFGQEVINQETGQLVSQQLEQSTRTTQQPPCFQDRAALMSLILEDESKRQRLNGITHPRIFRRMLWEIMSHAAKGHSYAVLDIPLLFETCGKMTNWLHKIIVVTCERDFQMQRLMEARSMSERESGLLIDAQMSLEEKAKKADYVVENSSGLDDLRKQVRIFCFTVKPIVCFNRFVSDRRNSC